MTLLSIIILACIQGLTEFLPISSSGHLVLAPYLFGWQDQGLAFDVAVHVGTLLAVVAVFRRDLCALACQGVTGVIKQDWHHPQVRLLWQLALATLPVVLVGLLWGNHVEALTRAPWVVAAATAGFALLLWFADARGQRQATMLQLTFYGALLIGLFQVLAIIPGTSRSGITITAALLLGLTRKDAARFSFLLSVPVIALAGAWQAWGLWQASVSVHWGALLLAAVVAALSAWICIRLFLAWVERVGMLPFVIYRLLLALAIVLILY